MIAKFRGIVMGWEDTYRSWAKALSITEQTKCENAETAIRKAIVADSALSTRKVSVFAQGSYCNRTNVRSDSDVDICVLSSSTIFQDFPDGMTMSDFGLKKASYHFSDYKKDVEQALVSAFGREHVRRGKKAFDVHENSYRVDADAVACFEYRRYQKDGSFIKGTSFIIDDTGKRVINWPQQNYDNGVQKNDKTKQRFKALVRILKRLKYKMVEEGITQAEPIPSFLIECLVWNVPNEGFNHNSYTDDVRFVLAYLFNNTRKDEECKDWTEINKLKYLFHSTQPWAREQVHAFISAAWNYVGLK